MKTESTPVPPIFSFVVVKFDVPNNLGRTYTKNGMESALLEFKEKIAKKQALGEFYADTSEMDSCDVSMKNVSHIVENVYTGNLQDGGDALVADVRILDTPKGKLVQELITDGRAPYYIYKTGLINLSMRASGIVSTDGRVEIKKIHAIDIIPAAIWSFRDKTNSIAEAFTIYKNTISR